MMILVSIQPFCTSPYIIIMAPIRGEALKDLRALETPILNLSFKVREVERILNFSYPKFHYFGIQTISSELMNSFLCFHGPLSFFFFFLKLLNLSISFTVRTDLGATSSVASKH